MARTTYTAETKARAVALYLEHGPAEASRRLHDETGVKVPSGTIGSWASRAGHATEAGERTAAATHAAKASRDQKREELRGLLLDKALDMLDRMDETHVDYRGKGADRVEWEKAPPQACQQYATAAAILIDKLRLELGEVGGARPASAGEKAAAVAEGRERGLRLVKDAAA